MTSVRCGYCSQVTWLAPTTHATAAPAPAAQSLHPLDRIGRGPTGESIGAGARMGPSAVTLTDAILLERALWPVGAEASSTFGGPWSPSTLLGPPRVYPRCGDIAGAWAPGPSQSPVEWIDVSFAGDVPVSAIRVFETNRAGSTYAVVDTTRGADVLYARGIEAWSGAAVLEVRLDAPRVIRSLRVYVVNRGWTEIDAVCLLAASPLPVPMRTAIPKPRSGCALMTVAALGGLVAVGVIAALVGRSAAPARRTLPSVAQTLSGASLAYGFVPPQALSARPIAWASAVLSRSSEYSSTRNAAGDALGPPDVYPRSGDLSGAWASSATDGGYEWITVRFATPVRASSVLWAETFNPGAVARVDDVSEGAPPTTLWEGNSGAPATAAAIGELRLPAPREINAVRLVLDTRRVAGWNEIDAIGLVPALPQQQ